MSLPVFNAIDDIIEQMQTIPGKLVPDWFSLVIQLSSFIILLLVVFFVAYKPVKKMLQKRQDYIQEEMPTMSQLMYCRLQTFQLKKLQMFLWPITMIL